METTETTRELTLLEEIESDPNVNQSALATQLGVQRHALAGVRRAVELVQAGAIGTVRECHAWIGGDRGLPDKPKEFPPVPPTLQWDLWLGPAAQRGADPHRS